MRITVWGTSPAWQDAGGARSGYLVGEEGTNVLLDCGNGVFSKLRRYVDYVDYVDIDAVVVSHMHADHFLDLGALHVRFHPVPHDLPTNAADVSPTNGGGRFTFGADHRPCPDLARFASGTDLLMLEATLPRPERDGIRGHLTPEEAGEHAQVAGTARLVLTHISDEMEEEWASHEAARSFGAPVHVAHEGDICEV